MLVPLAVVGAASIVRAGFSLFSAVGRRPGRMWTEETPAVGSDDFLRSLAAILAVPLVHGGRAELLNNGDEWLAQMFADFADARESITFCAYMWEEGRLNDMMVDALRDRARDGVRVRVLLDGVGAVHCPAETCRALEAAGAKISVFRPFKIGKLDHYHLRNHRRAIAIDGRVAYTGGMAVADHWLGDARNEKEWRDTMVRVTGPMAQLVQSAFTELWAYVCGEVLTGPAFFPKLEDDGSGVKSISVVSSPSSEEHPLHLLFFKSFMAARERIWITTPYFVPDKHSHQELIKRAKAGIDVRLLVPNNHTDAKAVRWAAHATYEKLLEAGARIFEYQPTMIHTKTMVVDGKWSIVGSANFDIRSKELNEENVLGILDKKLAGQIEKAFLADLEKSREIKLKEWRRRSIGARALERVSGLFAEQY